MALRTILLHMSIGLDVHPLGVLDEGERLGLRKYAMICHIHRKIDGSSTDLHACHASPGIRHGGCDCSPLRVPRVMLLQQVEGSMKSVCRRSQVSSFVHVYKPSGLCSGTAK